MSRTGRTEQNKQNPLGPNAPVATIAPTMIESTVLLGVMLQVLELTGPMGGKRDATHKPCENQAPNTTFRWVAPEVTRWRAPSKIELASA